MNKRCIKCNREDVEKLPSWYSITEYNNKSQFDLEEVKNIHCCESCWYHQQESKKYLGKPYYSIIHHDNHHRKMSRIQTQENHLIDIYRQIEARGISDINIQEVEEIYDFQSNMNKEFSLDNNEKQRLKELKQKYKLNNSSSNPSQIRSNTFSNNIPKGARPNPSNSNNSSPDPNQNQNPNKFNWKHPGIIGGLVVTGLAIIIGLTIYFFTKNKKNNHE